VKPVVLRPAAAADIEDAFDWYEAQRLALGDEFQASIRDILDRIANNPNLYQVVHRDTRRALLKRFP